VTVQAPDGTLVYVNQAAAEMLGCASPDEVLSTPLPRLLERFVVLDEHGRPYDLADLPGRHALAGREARPALTHTIDRETGDERWSLTKATPVRDAQGAIALAVNIIEDVTDARLVERRERFLGAASMLVSSSLDIDVTLDKVAWAAVPELADWCYVDMPDQRGVLRRAAVAGSEAEGVRDLVTIGDPDSPEHPLRTGESLVIADFDEEAVAAGHISLELFDAAVKATKRRGFEPLSADFHQTYDEFKALEKVLPFCQIAT